MEDNTIEDWKQHESKFFSQSTPTTIPVDHTWSIERRQSFGTAKSEMIDLELPRNVDESESESTNPEQSIDMYDHKLNEECIETSKPEPTTRGRRYPLGEMRAPTTYANQYILFTYEGEAKCYDEAIADEHEEKWLSAMQDEMDSLHDNYTYDLVELPKGKRALVNKWIYKVKTREVGITPKYKARIVVKGFEQKKGVDFDEIFASIVKMKSIRIVLSIAVSMDLEIKQLDVKTTFLHGELDEDIYMQQPKGFVEKGKENLVCQRKKSLYGLKQAPHQWYKKFESFMLEHKFQKTRADHFVFAKGKTKVTS